MLPRPENVLTVASLTMKIAAKLQATDEFKDLWVEGEDRKSVV